ncbi:MAG: DNA repair protein RecN (Recombination protein N) [Planctomycetota bacterium]|jgi:DNA repair protein RecN (Recombination protein N)
MLVELTITDLALIEQASLAFNSGLNVITGETGAGKSLLVDALELLLGQRAKAGMVRSGARRARVEGRFVMPLSGYGKLVAAWLEENLPETLEEWHEDGGEDDLELILTRTLLAEGRSQAHVNHRPVTQRLLRELASRLVEIHGQNDHQRLFEPLEQLRLVDTFGGHEDALAGYRERRVRWLEGARRLESFEAGEAERLQRLDLLRFQAAELEEANPDASEHEELVAERGRLRHAVELGSSFGTLLSELSEAEPAALDVVRRGERLLEEWEQRVPDLQPAANALREASAQLDEGVRELGSFLDRIEVDPQRLEQVEQRLDLLERLERKYRTDIAGLMDLRETLGAELAELQAMEAGEDELTNQVAEHQAAMAESARRLSGMRKKLFGKLRKAVEKGLADLGLERARFSAELTAPEASSEESDSLQAQMARFGLNGSEGVEFFLAANPGEPPQALRKVASGGEMARTMLALRGALAVRQSTPTLIFDEVDAGVGGRLGPKVGAHLGALGKHHQILCVTHLPAIAAAANHHMRVHKGVESGRTRTQVTPLTGEERVAEVADMISGGQEHATARAEAQRLLDA